MAVIEQSGHYLLQKRVSDPKRGAAGRIAAFGGQVEPGESSVQACIREVSEETTLTLAPNDLIYLGQVTVESDRDMEVVSIIADTYHVTLDRDTAVEAREGELVKLAKANVRDEKLLSPATKACFEELL